MNRRAWSYFTPEEIASWPEEHKQCRSCQEVLPFSQFHKNKNTLLGYNTDCKECRKPRSAKQYDQQSQEYRMWYRARARAKKHNIPFTITTEDIVIPEVCPVFDTPLVVGDRDHAPSLDQRNPRGGYTPDNIVVISNRANILKNNANSDELKKLIAWMDVTVTF